MAKAKKKNKKKGKYDITIKTNLTADELFKTAINLQILKQGRKKK